MSFKRQAYDHLHALALGADPKTVYHDEASLLASHPWNEIRGIAAIQSFWSTLRASFPDLERRDLVFLGGHSKEDTRVDASFTNRPMVAALGHFQWIKRACGPWCPWLEPKASGPPHLPTMAFNLM